MASQFSMLQIINAALSEQGQYTVTENDGSDEWMVLSRNWPLIVEAELEDGAYNFTRRQVELLNRNDGKFGFDDAYAVPIDAFMCAAFGWRTRPAFGPSPTGRRTAPTST